MWAAPPRAHSGQEEGRSGFNRQRVHVVYNIIVNIHVWEYNVPSTVSRGRKRLGDIECFASSFSRPWIAGVCDSAMHSSADSMGGSVGRLAMGAAAACAFPSFPSSSLPSSSSLSLPPPLFLGRTAWRGLMTPVS